MKNLAAAVEKIIKEKKGFIKKWQLPFWINNKIRFGDFDDLIKKLPLGLILSLKGGIKENRCVLFLITNTQYVRISECLKKRHPKDTHFPLNEIPPPISAVLKKGNTYIANPKINPLTDYMADLIRDEKIKAIYYTKVKTPRGDYVLVVDATGEKTAIEEDEKFFIDAIGQEIAEMEKERERKEEKNQETITFLLNLLLHLFRNKIMVIGGFTKRLKKIASQQQNEKCKKCHEKTATILAETDKIEKTIKIFENALHDIEMAATLNLTLQPFCDIIKPLADIDIKIPVIVDRRKVEKFLERIPPPPNIFIMEEERYIRISFPLEDEKMWRAALSMRPQNGIKNDHSENEFLLLISTILFKRMGGKVKLLDGFINIFFKRG
ncbi:MAG: hypothetical protein GWO87_02255 [Xanthomonadaceae bacterium]|nr:hypothetical protein [Rhodospirillaceae bacterium]NIA17989.1 hypothetical protein [Xanthomonadaceae bacterium]